MKKMSILSNTNPVNIYLWRVTQWKNKYSMTSQRNNDIWTYNTCCLHSLRHTACIGVAPEHVTLEMLAPSVHNEGKRVHIPSNAHEGQETDTALHQHLLLFFLHRQPIGESDLQSNICSIRSTSKIWYFSGQQQNLPCLIFDDSQCGVSNTQYDRSPVLFACWRHEAVYGPIYDVHTWGQSTGEREQWDSVWLNLLHAGCVMTCVWVSVLIQVYLWGETRMSYPDTTHETSAPTLSLAWGTLHRKHTH